MSQPERGPLSSEGQDKPPEQLWLEEKIPIFWPLAHLGYEEQGRGAVMINVASETDFDDAQFHYASLERIREDDDAVSERLAQLVSEYDPIREFVAVMIKPDLVVNTFHIPVEAQLVEAVNAYTDPDYRPKAVEEEPELETPDLETLIAWESEGICEAACPHACIVEPDGVCPHGKPSWLLKLGLI